MKATKKLLAIIFVIVLSISMIPTTNVSAAKRVKLNKTKATIYVGKTVTLKLKNNKKKVKWTTSNKKIATVSKKGKVKGKKAGKVTITAKVGKKKYKCKITVKKKSTPKPTEQPTTKPTETPTTKPIEQPTTKPIEKPTETEPTTPSDDVEEPSLNPQIRENVETLKKINEIQQEQGTVDEELLNKINEINESEAHEGLVWGTFNIDEAVQTIVNDTTRYNKYIEYHGGFYDDKYYNGDYDGVFVFNDSIVKYMWDGVDFDNGYLDLTNEDLANTYKFTMFEGDIPFNSKYYENQYKQILSNYMKIGHPKFNSIDTFILETEPQKYYDETGAICSKSIEYDNQDCSYIVTFLSDGRIYNAYMSFAEVEDNDGNVYCEYRLLDLTVEPITKDYMNTLDVNWDLEQDKWLTITEPFADIESKESDVQITNYKIDKAEKEGYNQLSFTYVIKKNWSPTIDEILTATNSIYSQQTGKWGGGYYFALVDYNTGISLEKENDFNVIVDEYIWNKSDYERFSDNNTGAWVELYRTTTVKVSLTYPQEYTELCIVIGGQNQLIQTNTDSEFWNGKEQFGDTSYYKSGKYNSHWMRVVEN